MALKRHLGLEFKKFIQKSRSKLAKEQYVNLHNLFSDSESLITSLFVLGWIRNEQNENTDSNRSP